MHARWYLVAALSAGCGSVEIADAGFDGSGDDASSTDAFEFGDGVVPFDSAPAFDVNIGLVDGGGSFECGVFVCDGRTQYCDTSSVGPPGPPYCHALPDGCVPANCVCLPNANLGQGCSCDRATTGDGLVAGCAAP